MCGSFQPHVKVALQASTNNHCDWIGPGFCAVLCDMSPSCWPVQPKLCAFFRSESWVTSQSEGGLKQRPCKLLVIQGLLCIKSYAQDYLWIASLEAAFLLGFRGPSQKPCLSRSW